MNQKIETPEQTNPAPNLYITPPEILRVVALLEVAGSRRIASLRAREGSDEDAEQTDSLAPLEGLGI